MKTLEVIDRSNGEVRRITDADEIRQEIHTAALRNSMDPAKARRLLEQGTTLQTCSYLRRFAREATGQS